MKWVACSKLVGDVGRPYTLNLFQVLLLFIALLPSIALASSFQGQVVKVSDGDTIQVMHNGKAEKIRVARLTVTDAAKVLDPVAAHMPEVASEFGDYVIRW